ncbi:unnamed protein product [Urochloa decumbens]|uniref:Rx N-terminal domain-containing protein n=1 Tax=Urochloa decumbens TaxID=240449 RepID=A0ABC8Z1T6_9POAL
MQILEATKILDLPLLGVFVDYLKARWSDRSRVDQRRRRLRQLVSMLRAVTDAGAGSAAAVRDGSLSAWLNLLRAEALRGQEVLDAAGCDASAVAGSARRFVAGLRSLLVCSAEVDRLNEAVDELERLAGPGGDLATFVKVLRLEDARPRAPAMMDIDGRPANPAACSRRRQEASGGGAESVASGGALPVLGGAKRKRCSCGSAAADASAADVAERHKRRALPWMRPRQWLPSGLGGLFLARPPPPGPPHVPASRPDRAREVALAMARVRRRIGKTARRRRQPSLGQHFSRISL